MESYALLNGSRPESYGQDEESHLTLSGSQIEMVNKLSNADFECNLKNSGCSANLLKPTISLSNLNLPHISKKKLKWGLKPAIKGIPGLLIVLILNLFLSVSIGQAFFPSDWTFPENVPRAMGVQMFLIATAICQFVLTAMSDFPAAHGMMMLENIPFMHTIAYIAIKHQGMGEETFATIFVAFGLCSILVGVIFFILGFFRIGNVLYYIPRYVIIGCIGGIGIFLMRTGIEVSTNHIWLWNIPSILSFFESSIYPLWIASVLFEIGLIILQKLTKSSPIPIPPFYFISIPPIFYVFLLISQWNLNDAHDYGWFFESSPKSDYLLMWKLIKFKNINWMAILEATPTLLGMTLF
eukprot:gene6494-13106_t